MPVLLLGSSGFVGSNVAQVFGENSIEFIPACRSLGIDLRDVNQVQNLIKKTKPKFIVNCAAHVGSLNYVTQQAADVIIDNAAMVMSMYKAVATESTHTVVVNPIANCAYPGSLETYIEDQFWNGAVHRSVLSYGSTRRFLMALSECFYMQHNVRTISLLVPNMYGAFDSTDPNKAHAMNALISKFVKAKNEATGSVPIWGSGIAIREWLYARDFAQIIVEIINNPNKLGLDEPTNIGQNFGLSVREIVSLIRAHTSFEGQVEFDHSKPDGAPKKVMSDQRFRKVFPDFRFTPMDKGVTDTVEYYQSIYPY